MDQPFFSVIIPTLNEEKFLPHLLDSLVAQTIKNFEVIVIDGASHDKTIAVANSFKKKLPLTILSSKVAGVSRQRNMGADKAKADWLVFIDADTVLLPLFFERVQQFILHHHPSFFTTWFRADSDEPTDAIFAFLGNILVEGSILIDRPWSPGPLTIIKRNAFTAVGGYDEGTTFAEDHDLAMKVFERGVRLQVLHEILFIYSLRRYRTEGTLRAISRYAKSALLVIITKRGPKHMPGFIAGGQLYKKRKPQVQRSAFREFQSSLKKFMTAWGGGKVL